MSFVRRRRRIGLLIAQCNGLINITNIASLVKPPICSTGGVPTTPCMIYEDNAFIQLMEDGPMMLMENIQQIPLNWFDTAYKSRVPITIQAGQIVGTHTDFPFLFNSTVPDLIGKVQANGGDIRFALEDKTELKSEIRFIDSLTGEITAFAKIPSIQVGTTFFMYYNNVSAVLPTDTENVWLNNPVTELNSFVYHMSQSPATLLDSTKNSEIVVGTVAAAVGKIGNASQFPGTSDIETFVLPDPRSATVGNLGWMSVWVKPNGDLTTNQYVVMFNSNKWGVLLGFQDNMWNLFLYPNATDPLVTEFPAELNAFVKIDFVITPDTPFNKVQIYKDGVEIPGSPFDDENELGRLGSVKLVFGSFDAGAFYTGIMDEFRFMENVPSPSTISDRILAAYKNENNPVTFYGIGTPQIIGESVEITEGGTIPPPGGGTAPLTSSLSKIAKKVKSKLTKKSNGKSKRKKAKD